MRPHRATLRYTLCRTGATYRGGRFEPERRRAQALIQGENVNGPQAHIWCKECRRRVTGIVTFGGRVFVGCSVAPAEGAHACIRGTQTVEPTRSQSGRAVDRTRDQ